MATKTYSEKLKDSNWQQRREDILNSGELKREYNKNFWDDKEDNPF
jgi:hypothetical protein